MSQPPQCRKPASAPQPVAAEVQGFMQVLESAALFRGRVEIVIRHNGRDYRLRQTRLGKLILTA